MGDIIFGISYEGGRWDFIFFIYRVCSNGVVVRGFGI